MCNNEKSVLTYRRWIPNEAVGRGSEVPGDAVTYKSGRETKLIFDAREVNGVKLRKRKIRG